VTTDNQTGWTVATKISLLALFVSTLSFGVSFYNMQLTQMAQDRATGKIKAKFEFVGVGNTDEKSLAPFYKKSKLGFETVYIDDVEHLIKWNPFIEIKNTGEEVIDGIRVEVRFTSGMVVTPKAAPTPYVLNEAIDLDLTLKEKVHPGQTAKVSMMKPLLGQMVQAQTQELADREPLGTLN
jgi:hypothetical protein